jgi:large subunit ribosomal protein L14e
MNMFEIGRICVKLAGRDAGMKCVIIDSIDDNFVMIDGQTRRRKCNLKHLEPTNQLIEIGKNASSTEVANALKEIGIEVFEKKTKAAKTSKPRPKKEKGKKEKPVKKPVKQTRAEKANAKKQATEAVEAAIESEDKKE